MLKINESKTILDTMQLSIDVLEETENEFLYEDIRETELENINNEVQVFIETYEKRYHTDIAAIAFVGERFSWYGSIGGNGNPVGTSSEYLELEDCLYGCDDFKLIITERNTLRLDKLDHDGCNSMEMRLVTKNEISTYYNYENDYINLAEYVYCLEKEPTKLSNHFKLMFGA